MNQGPHLFCVCKWGKFLIFHTSADACIRPGTICKSLWVAISLPDSWQQCDMSSGYALPVFWCECLLLTEYWHPKSWFVWFRGWSQATQEIALACSCNFNYVQTLSSFNKLNCYFPLPPQLASGLFNYTDSMHNTPVTEIIP